MSWGSLSTARASRRRLPGRSFGQSKPLGCTDGSGWVANTWELVTVRYWGGNVGSDLSVSDIYVNGKYVGFGSTMNGLGNNTLPLNVPTSNLTIGNLSGGNQDWYGGLNDIGVWATDLTGPFNLTTLNEGTEGAEGGEVGALYNVPMYNGHSRPALAVRRQRHGPVVHPLRHPGLAEPPPSPPATARSPGSTFRWDAVAARRATPATTGTGQYFVQLDSNGGGVETVVAPTPEPGMLALLASGLVGLLAYAWRKRK